MDKPAVTLRSIGCRTNQEEMVSIAASLSEEGYRLVDAAAEANIIIVNTCSVTGAAESKTRRFLSNLAADAPQAKICVTGCLAQQDPEGLLKIQGVAWVVGNRLKNDIGHLVATQPGGSYTAALTGADAGPLAVSTALPAPDAPVKRRTRFSVKIQEGCDFRCSYCIVPQLRGPSRSATADAVADACRRAVAAGYKEIVLTGTHIGQFHDRDCDSRLTGLLDRLLAIDGDFRIRLSSLDPRDCTEVLLGYIGTVDRICDHVHVSLQSLSPAVLATMRRPVDATMACFERLIRFRRQYPLVGIGADVIVGFPGEDDGMFEQTFNGCGRMELSYAHVFRFSPRPGTAAATLTSTVAESEKSRRSNLLRKLVQQSRACFLKKVEHTPQRIIVESLFPIRGLTSNYLHVELSGGNATCNAWMDVAVCETSGRGRYCPAQPVLRKVA
jgi:threonylcarbamoyladenosine tRNA methylthiotransferase MtaB